MFKVTHIWYLKCIKDTDEEYFLEVVVQYPRKLHHLHNDLPCLPEWTKIEKAEKIVANLHNKKEYVMQTRNSKQALNHELVLKKVHILIELNQEAWLKPYIDINAELRKNAYPSGLE